MSKAYDFTFELSMGELDFIFHQSPCSNLVELVVQQYDCNLYETKSVTSERGLTAAVRRVRDELMGQVEAFNEALKCLDTDEKE